MQALHRIMANAPNPEVLLPFKNLFVEINDEQAVLSSGPCGVSIHWPGELRMSACIFPEYVLAVTVYSPAILQEYLKPLTEDDNAQVYDFCDDNFYTHDLGYDGQVAFALAQVRALHEARQKVLA